MWYPHLGHTHPRQIGPHAQEGDEGSESKVQFQSRLCVLLSCIHLAPVRDFPSARGSITLPPRPPSQLLDRAGSLYGELARFVLRVLFRRRPVKTAEPHRQLGPGQPGQPSSEMEAMQRQWAGAEASAGGRQGAIGGLTLGQGQLALARQGGGGQWDNLWGGR
jgi:hypothetical protein